MSALQIQGLNERAPYHDIENIEGSVHAKCTQGTELIMLLQWIWDEVIQPIVNIV